MKQKSTQAQKKASAERTGWKRASRTKLAIAARARRVVFRFICKRCGWKWEPKGVYRASKGKELPKQCPHCRSPYWARKRVRKVSARPGVQEGVQEGVQAAQVEATS